MTCSVCGCRDSRKWVRGKCSRCYHREYNRTYFADPEVKGRRQVREREKKRTPEWRAKNARWTKASRLREYGLTVEAFDTMFASQGGCCAICRVAFVEDDDRKKARVDHDHATGAVRGLLCDGCNTSIGRLGDTAEALIGAAEYLVTFEEKQRAST